MNKWFIWFCYFVRLTPPKRANLEEYLDFLIPKVRYYGEDLVETEYYLGKRWNEFRPNSSDVILHIFDPKMKPSQLSGPPGTDHLRVTNGDVSVGAWSFMEGNKMIIQHPNQELYDLSFLNDYFFIIRKHGTNNMGYKSKYLVLINSGGLRSIMSQALGTKEVSIETMAELLYLYYVYNNFIAGFIIFVIPVVIFILYMFFG